MKIHKTNLISIDNFVFRNQSIPGKDVINYQRSNKNLNYQHNPHIFAYIDLIHTYLFNILISSSHIVFDRTHSSDLDWTKSR